MLINLSDAFGVPRRWLLANSQASADPLDSERTEDMAVPPMLVDASGHPIPIERTQIDNNFDANEKQRYVCSMIMHYCLE